MPGEDGNETISFEEDAPSEIVAEKPSTPFLLSIPQKLGMAKSAEASRRISFIIAILLLLGALFLFLRGSHAPPGNPPPSLVNHPQPMGSLP